MFEVHEGKLARGARVVYRTGWDARFGTPEFFTEYPSLTLEAARWDRVARDPAIGNGYADAEQ